MYSEHCLIDFDNMHTLLLMFIAVTLFVKVSPMSGDLFAHLHAFCSLCIVVVVSFLELTFFSLINSFVVPQALQLTHSSGCCGALNMALVGVR